MQCVNYKFLSLPGLYVLEARKNRQGLCSPRSPKARDRGHPPNSRAVTFESSIPGPQKRGTGGTLFVVRDRGHPSMMIDLP
jgi:hypothetical protein